MASRPIYLLYQMSSSRWYIVKRSIYWTIPILSKKTSQLNNWTNRSQPVKEIKVSSSNMSFPTPAQIEEIFKLRESTPAAFFEHLDDNVVVTIMGNEHEMSGEITGKEALMFQHVQPILDLLDLEKSPTKQEIVRIVGGGDPPWAAVELKTTSTSKIGTFFFIDCHWRRNCVVSF